MSDIRDGMNQWQAEETNKMNAKGIYGIPEHVKATMSEVVGYGQGGGGRIPDYDSQALPPSKPRPTTSVVDEKLREIISRTNDAHSQLTDKGIASVTNQIKQTLRDLIKDRLPKESKQKRHYNVLAAEFAKVYDRGYNQCLEDVTAILEELLS